MVCDVKSTNFLFSNQQFSYDCNFPPIMLLCSKYETSSLNSCHSYYSYYSLFLQLPQALQLLVYCSYYSCYSYHSYHRYYSHFIYRDLKLITFIHLCIV